MQASLHRRLERGSLDISAGIAMGMLAGILIGLSASPVVAAVLTSLIAVVVTFIGFLPEGNGSQGRPWPKPPLRRIIAFSSSCLVAVLAGLWLRTHDTLSPSLADEAQTLKEAGLDSLAIRQILVARALAVLPPAPETDSKAGKKEDKKQEPAPDRPPSPVPVSVRSSVLFSTGATSRDHLDPSRLDDAKAVVDAWADAGGSWHELALRLERIPDPAQRHEAAKKIWEHLESIRKLLPPS